MALQLNYVTVDQGFECPEAYLVVQNCRPTVGSPQAVAQVEIYRSKQFRYDGRQPVIRYDLTYPFIPGDASMLAQAYNFLKTLPDFAKAVDA